MDENQFTGLKVLAHMENLREIALRDGFPYPISVEIDLSNNCNHDCYWCMFQGFIKEDSNNLSEVTIDRIIRDLSEVGVKSIIFAGGGEPLMNKYASKAMRLCGELKIEYSLITNGELLTEEIFDVLLDSAKYVRISIDASNENTYKKIHSPKNRKSGQFERVVSNTSKLVQKKKENGSCLVIGVGFLSSQYNYTEIYETAELCEKLGVDYFQVRPAYVEESLLSEEEVEIANKQVIESQKLGNGNFEIIGNTHRYDLFKHRRKDYQECYASRLTSIVGADGNVYLCCQLRGNSSFIIGNIYKNRFKEIWGGPRHKELLRTLDINKCPPCRYDYYNKVFKHCILSDELHINFI